MAGGRGQLPLGRAFTGGVVVLAAALFVWAVPGTLRVLPHVTSAFWSIALLGLIIDIPLYAARRQLGAPPRTTLSVCFTFAVFLIWGAAPAIVLQAFAGAIAAYGQRRSLGGGVFLVARLVLALAAAEIVVHLAERRPLTRPGEGLTGDDVISFLLPAVTWFIVSFGLLALVRLAVYGGPVRAAVTELREDVLATAASMLLVSPLLTTVRGWWSLLVAVPLFAWNQLSREYARREERMRREPVTGLLNRRGLVLGTEALTANDALDPARRRPFGVVLLNVESVLAIGRTLGREVYEEIVTIGGRRLVSVFGADQVGRLAGEGFVVIVPGLTEEEAVPQATRGVAALTPVIEVDEIPFALDPAAGVALSPQHGRDFATLVARAELAMAEARRLGLPATLYMHQAREIVQRRIEILAELRAVLTDPARRAELAVYFQPQVRVDTGRLAGAEALVRWTHPEWGPVSPDELIEAVEPTQVMHLLTRRMLVLACAQMRAWNERGLLVRVAVNASVHDLHDPDFPDEIAKLLEHEGLPPEQLTIEITERMVIDNSERVTRAATKIAELGVGLSLDDFGTGYASLQQLQALPLTEVKIDKSYVSRMASNPSQYAIVNTVHELAETLQLEVVAEGVEDEPTAAALARMPGTIGQGWFFGRPEPAEVFEQRWKLT